MNWSRVVHYNCHWLLKNESLVVTYCWNWPPIKWEFGVGGGNYYCHSPPIEGLALILLPLSTNAGVYFCPYWHHCWELLSLTPVVGLILLPRSLQCTPRILICLKYSKGVKVPHYKPYIYWQCPLAVDCSMILTPHLFYFPFKVPLLIILKCWQLRARGITRCFATAGVYIFFLNLHLLAIYIPKTDLVHQ